MIAGSQAAIMPLFPRERGLAADLAQADAEALDMAWETLRATMRAATPRTTRSCGAWKRPHDRIVCQLEDPGPAG